MKVYDEGSSSLVHYGTFLKAHVAPQAIYVYWVQQGMKKLFNFLQIKNILS